MQVHEIWNAALSEIAIQIPRPSFETWLVGTKGVRITGDEFVVEVPNAFVAQMLDDRMYSVISFALRLIIGEEIEVRLQDETLKGKFKDLDVDGTLVLEVADGKLRRISAGDVYFGA